MGPITGGATIVLSGSVRANGLRRAALGAAIAGLGTCALMLFGYWSFRVNGPSPSGTGDVLISLALWIAIGATAGLVSGRFRDAPASWVAAMIGVLMAYWVFYTMLFPGSRYPGEDGFEGDVVMTAAFLLPLIVGGHLLGASAAGHAMQRAKARG
jgi:hypothetical protein